MRIGIIGSGVVGRALATGFKNHGHDPMVGTRDPSSGDIADWGKEAGVPLGTFEEVAKHGEVVALATLGAANAKALELAGAENLAGKVLIDATNPLEFVEGRPPGLFVSGNDSGGEQVQRAVPDARVVKAFNIVGNTFFADPDLPGGPPTMIIAGDDEEAKGTVTDILTEFGWETIDIGGIEG